MREEKISMKLKKKVFRCLSLFAASLCLFSLVGCKEDNAQSNSSSQSQVSDGTCTIADPSGCTSVTEAISIANAAGEEGTTEKYYVYGTITTVSNPTYGEMTITDGTNSLYIYGTYSKDGVLRYSDLDDKPVKGDEVILYGQLKTFKNSPEMGSGWIQDFKHNAPDMDPNDYTQKTVVAARNDAADAKVKLTGVVAKITYANGMIPNGFYLVDTTGSIYIYGEIAAQVQEGNTVTIAGEKTYYVLESEKGNAEKYGYPGSCQITNPYLLENDNQVSDFDKSWIEEKTVKEIVNTPISENITTNIYKVNALIKKVPGTGFVNYYIHDLDDKTGSYVYTMCNGSDFAYLDEFDGKICTVYLSPINAKSTDSGCFFRFMPIDVIDEGFVFDLKDTAEFVVEYYGIDQFIDTYTGDPNAQLIRSVSSTLLGFENATLSYESDNTDVVYFETVGDDLFMHTKNVGTANITITGSYGSDSTYNTKVQVEVVDPTISEFVDVKTAIEAQDNEIVQVKGVVAASLVNQTGFYLIDETGVLAIRTDKETMKNINLGNMVIMKGTRAHYKAEGEVVGQSCLLDATLVRNLYGDHEYSKATFDSTKTLEELYELSVKEDYTTQVYVVTGKIKVNESYYSKTFKLTNIAGDLELNLYTSGKEPQYSFLEPYDGVEATFEIAPCNWNTKSWYAFCALSITVDGQTIVNDCNFLN